VWVSGRFFLFLAFSTLLLIFGTAASIKPSGFQRNLESFFGSVDQDGNGEIEQVEATKFLEHLDTRLMDKYGTGAREGTTDLLISNQFEAFSYGGTTISSEEMMDHLKNMMTANHVVDWVTHGLQLPQYAEAFRQNAIMGLDFPALIENESRALAEELGVQSILHRTKITHAIVRQVFGLGATPAPPQGLNCTTSNSGGIQLKWEVPPFHGSPPLHKHLVQRWNISASMWIQVSDTQENMFLDKGSLIPGSIYSYRVQSWGGHGPSKWVSTDGCMAGENLAPAVPLSVSARVPPLQPQEVDSVLKTQVKQHIGDNTNSGTITWLNSVVIVLFALLSRHAYFFYVLSAALRYLKEQMWMKLVQALESQYLWLRIFARCLVTAWESWESLIIWTRSRTGVQSPTGSQQPLLFPEPLPAVVPSSSSDLEYSRRPLISRSASADSLMESNGYYPSLSPIEVRGRSSSYSKSGTETDDEIDQRSVAASTSPRARLEGPTPYTRWSKKRCNHEGCKTRFDRWHSVHDWWMKLNNHYCRECQRVFCVKHTRISPHGPRGQCGLDSNCYCYTCFSSLSSESKRKLEERNKLRFGPLASTSEHSFGWQQRVSLH